MKPFYISSSNASPVLHDGSYLAFNGSRFQIFAKNYSIRRKFSQAPTSWICLPLRLGAFGRKGMNLSSTTKLLGCLDGKEFSGLKLYFTFIGYLSTKEC